MALPCRGQELEPRAYSPNPTGANFVLAGLGHSSGDVVFDASLPFSDVQASIHSGSLVYGRTFGLLGRSASATLALPYVWGSVEGNVGEDFRRVTRSGLGDLRARLAVNLVGGPALAPREFAARRPRSALGVSFAVIPPTGQYDPVKLINLGSNRWSFKPEMGFSAPAGRFFLEAYAGVWLFTDNSDFYGGSRREQNPLGTLQAHVSYSFKPRLWLAGDATFYGGGRSTVDGVRKEDVQSNSRVGLTLAVPVTQRQSLKLAWAQGFTTRIGGDFQTFSVAWQLLWFDKP